MKIIKSIYVVISLLCLMIVRVFVSGNWVGSVAVAGLLVAWIDITNQVRLSLSCFRSPSEKKRYGKVLAFLVLTGAVQLILIIVNLIIGINWLNHPLLLDEISLFSLLICLAEREFVNMFVSIIKKEFLLWTN